MERVERERVERERLERERLEREWDAVVQRQRRQRRHRSCRASGKPRWRRGCATCAAVAGRERPRKTTTTKRTPRAVCTEVTVAEGSGLIPP